MDSVAGRGGRGRRRVRWGRVRCLISGIVSVLIKGGGGGLLVGGWWFGGEDVGGEG